MNGPGVVSDQERDQREAEAAAIHSAASPPLEVPKSVTLSNGIELKIRKVPPLLLTRAQEALPKPKVPIVHIEGRGEEENPIDPDYLEAVDAYNNAVNMAALNAMLLTGTALVSTPDGVDKPDDPGWADVLDALGIPIPSSTAGRYLAWLRYSALEDPMDMLTVMSAVGRVTGISEGDVLKAVESFRRNEGPGADPGNAADQSATDGDRIPAAAGGVSP